MSWGWAGAPFSPSACRSARWRYWRPGAGCRRPGHRARHLDLVGTALLGAALVTLLLPLAEGSSLGWPWWCWLLMLASPAIAAVFWRTQESLHRKGRVPLIPPPLLRLKTFRLGLVMAVILMAGYGAFTFEYTLLTQTGLGWTPLHAALVTVPFALVFLVVSIIAGNLVPRFGSRRILTAGATVQGVSLAAMTAIVFAEGGALDSLSLGGSMIAMGIGQAMMLGPLVGVVLVEIPAPRRAPDRVCSPRFNRRRWRWGLQRWVRCSPRSRATSTPHPTLTASPPHSACAW